MFEAERILCICIAPERLQVTKVIIQQILVDLGLMSAVGSGGWVWRG